MKYNFWLYNIQEELMLVNKHVELTLVKKQEELKEQCEIGKRKSVKCSFWLPNIQKAELNLVKKQ